MIAVYPGSVPYQRMTYLVLSGYVTSSSLPAGVYCAANDANITGTSSTGHIPVLNGGGAGEAVTVRYGGYSVVATAANVIGFTTSGGPTNTSGTVTFSLSTDSSSEPYGFLIGVGTRSGGSTTVSATLSEGSSVTVSGDYLKTVGSNRAAIVPLRIRKYTVSFDANGGSGAPSSISAVHGGSWTCPRAEPAKSGMTFKGWATSESATSPQYLPGGTYSGITANLSLYAVWAANSGLLVYNANGGTVTPGYKAVAVGSAYGTLPVPVRSGFSFLGWFTAATGGSSVTSATVMDASGSAVIYARWSGSASTNTVHFNPMGGTVSETSRTVTEGAMLGTLPVPTRTGYTFEGWFDPAQNPITASTVMGDDDIYAIAAWTGSPVTVTFDPTGGAVTPASRSVPYGSRLGALPVPVRSGFSFQGWFTDATGGTPVTATDIITSPQTIYAVWGSASVPWWGISFY